MKFVQRNRSLVAATILIFLTLAAGIVATAWQASVARKERDAARVQQAKAARINAFLQEMVGYANTEPGSPNRKTAHDATVAEMLDDAAGRVETELADQPEVRAEMLSTIGATYLGQAKYDRARRYLSEAYDLNVTIYGGASLQAAAIMHSFAWLSAQTGDVVTAESWFRKALPIYRSHVNDPASQIQSFVTVLSDGAFIMRALGRLDEAEALWREALTYAPRLPAKYRGLGIVPKTYLAQLYMDRGDFARAYAMASEASQQLRSLGSDRVPLAASLIDLGVIRRAQRRYPEAEALITEGTKLYVELQGKDHPNVAFGMYVLAMTYFYEGRFDLAEQQARNALAIVDKLPNTAFDRARVRVALGRILNRTGRSGEAEPMLREAVAFFGPNAPKRSNAAAVVLGSLGECLQTQKRYADAEPLLRESYEILAALHVSQSPALAEARERLVSLYEAWGKPREAARYRLAPLPN